MFQRVSQFHPVRRISDVLAAAAPSNVNIAKSVLAKPGSRLPCSQTASSKTLLSSTAKTVPRYAQSTQSASSRTTPPLARRKALESSNTRVVEPVYSSQKRLRDVRRRKQDVPTTKPKVEALNNKPLGYDIYPDRDSIDPSGLGLREIHDTVALSKRSFVNMIVGTRIPISTKSTQKHTAFKAVPKSTPVAAVVALRPIIKHKQKAVRRATLTDTNERSAGPGTPASRAKTVRFSDKPDVPRQFDPKEPSQLLNSECSGEWSPLMRKDGRPWRLYCDSSAARGGTKVFVALSTNDWWTLQPGFLNRFRSVQSYEQLRITEAAAQGVAFIGCQVGYGTTTYKIDLRPSTVIRAEHIGILQDPLQMGTKVPKAIDVTSKTLCLVFGAFEKVEKVSFRNIKVPKTIVPASMEPTPWPATTSKRRLEAWVKNTWPRRSREDC